MAGQFWFPADASRRIQMNFFSTVFSNCRANTLLIHALREYFTRGMNRISFISRVKRAVLYVSTTLAYSSLRNEEWGIWKRGISREENRREKWENVRPKIKHFGSIFSYSANTCQKKMFNGSQNVPEVWNIPMNSILYADNRNPIGFSITATSAKWEPFPVSLAFCCTERQ